MKSSKVSWCVFWIWDPRGFHNSFFMKNNLISIISALFKNGKRSSSYKGWQTTYKIMKMFDIARDIRDFFSFFIWKTLNFVRKSSAERLIFVLQFFALQVIWNAVMNYKYPFRIALVLQTPKKNMYIWKIYAKFETNCKNSFCIRVGSFAISVNL